MTFLLETLRLGLANLWLHKLRSLLTALGIIIGVGAVVAIAAYGEGTKRAAVQDILALGATNIIVKSVKPPPIQDGAEGEDNASLNVYGLTRQDVLRLERTVGPIERLVPLKQIGDRVSVGVTIAPAQVFWHDAGPAPGGGPAGRAGAVPDRRGR